MMENTEVSFVFAGNQLHTKMKLLSTVAIVGTLLAFLSSGKKDILTKPFQYVDQHGK